MNDIFINGKLAACSPDPGAWPTDVRGHAFHAA